MDAKKLIVPPSLVQSLQSNINEAATTAVVAKMQTTNMINNTTTHIERAYVFRLCISDSTDSMKYLIDTGADVSVLPYSLGVKSNIHSVCASKLYAANGTEIKTYGVVRKTVNLNLRRDFTWNFVLADVSQPILGADFFGHFNLLIDMKNHTLIDGTTELKRVCAVVNIDDIETTKTFETTHPYADLLNEFKDITDMKKQCEVRDKSDVFHHIETNGPPVFARARRLNGEKLFAAKKEFEYLVEMGICQQSKSSYASPLHMVKKQDGSWRPTGDYRALNAQTKPDRYSIPHIQDFAWLFAEKKVFSVLDLCRAYHQIRLHPDSIPKTAIITPFGLFEYKYMCFGLCGAAQTFQRHINQVLFGLDFVGAYIDDMVIASANEAEHREHLRIVFDRLRQYGLTINVGKCQIAQSSVTFLGNKIDADGASPLPKKVDVIKNFTRPTIAKCLKTFLNMINFYRRFIPQAVRYQIPLQALIPGNKKNDKSEIQWTDETIECFEKCKESLVNATQLAHPVADAPLVLYTDASDVAAAGALHQLIDDVLQPLGFFSKKFTGAETRYSTYDRELTAIFLSVKHFKSFVDGRPLIIYTDHKPLTFALQQDPHKASPRQARQLDFVSQYTTDIRYVAGEANAAADFLSRIDNISTRRDNNIVDFAQIAEHQKTCPDLKKYLEDSNTTLQLKRIAFEQHTLYCDISTNRVRPFIPLAFREKVVLKMHDIAHPGIRATIHLVGERFVWPGMRKDIKQIVTRCVKCQLNKVQRHTKSTIEKIPVTKRFAHVHLDIVGQLPSSKGNNFVLTMIDRFTRWPEAVPISDSTAPRVAEAFITHWVSRFGVPESVTTDLGRQFESKLFAELMNILGITHLRTTSYHPQSSGILERWHRALKASIKCRANESWSDELPLILLAHRNQVKEDIGVTPAQLVLGTAVTLPGEMIAKTDGNQVEEQTDFVKQLRLAMHNLRPTPTSHHGERATYIPKDLHTASHVFLRIDKVRTALASPYSGPHRVIKRNGKYFTVELNHKPCKISVDRLKPAAVFQITTANSQPLVLPSSNKPNIQRSTNASSTQAASAPLTVRKNSRTHTQPLKSAMKTIKAGRSVRMPVRFQ